MKNNLMYIQIGTLKLAWRSLTKNKARSLLTSLGVIIGAATIVLVIEMGSGASAQIEEQYSNMSVTTILINAPSADGKKSKLDVEDADELKKSENISLAVPQLTGKVQVSGGDNSYQAGILGSFPEFVEIVNLEMNQGRFFNQEEEEDHIKVAVLGATVVEELYGAQDAEVIGETIVIGKKQFEIIGIAEYKGGSIGPISVDDSIVLPYSSSYRYVLGKSGKFNLNIQATNVDVINLAMEDAGVILRESHGLKAGMVDDFRLRDMGANVQSAKDSAKTMALLLGSVGFIVLLVGGIGIMNVMHIIVKERTKEIGIRKAIGAQKSHIMLQFLLESIILSVFGAVIGLIMATGIFYILKAYGLDIVFVWWSYGLSVLFTVSIGVFFGYYPAMQASQLKPIDTLRYE
jgi:putative ABC transport system permease protein